MAVCVCVQCCAAVGPPSLVGGRLPQAGLSNLFPHLLRLSSSTLFALGRTSIHTHMIRHTTAKITIILWHYRCGKTMEIAMDFSRSTRIGSSTPPRKIFTRFGAPPPRIALYAPHTPVSASSTTSPFFDPHGPLTCKALKSCMTLCFK